MQGVSHFTCPVLTHCGFEQGDLLVPCSLLRKEPSDTAGTSSHVSPAVTRPARFDYMGTSALSVGCPSNKEIGRWKPMAPTCLPQPPWGLHGMAPGGLEGRKSWGLSGKDHEETLSVVACTPSVRGQIRIPWHRGPPTSPSSSSVGLNLEFLHFMVHA